MSDQKITIDNGKLIVPDKPTIPFIEGDGTGVDIWPASQHVFDSAVEKAYKGKRKIEWKEVLAGEKAFNKVGSWMPEETMRIFREYLIGIKGPLTTPVGGGIRSLNVALRQELDLYACVRPVRWFKGVPSPVKEPHKTDMVIFRENTEDIYAGIEFQEGTDDNKKFLQFFKDNFAKQYKKIRFPESSGIGIKPVSREGTERLVRSALEHGVARSAEDKEPGRFPQVSGVRFAFDARRPPGSRIVELTVNGKPLDEKKKYTLATTEYVGIDGGDGYAMLKEARLLTPREQGQFDSDVLQAAIAVKKVIAPKVEGRIKRLDKDQRQNLDCR